MTEVVTLYEIDFVGSPEILAMLVEFHMPELPYSSNPILMLLYSFEHRTQNRTNLKFIQQRN